MLNKRRMLASGLGGLGLIALMERLARRPGLVVLTYHRIGDPAASTAYRPVYSASVEGFRAEVAALKRSFRVLGQDEMVEAAESGLSVKEPCAAITFDDGYIDNYEQAFPVLRDLGVPATFFVVPGFVDGPRPYWWDVVSDLVRRSDRDLLVLEYPTPATVDLRGDRDRAIAAVIGPCLEARPLDEDRLREHLEERAGVAVDDDRHGRGALMTWDQIRTMADAGMGIGSHGMNHRRLADLDVPAQSAELVRSKRTIEERIGREVASLAYPYGSPDAVGDWTRRLAREAGYRAAFAFRIGVNRPGRSDPFDLARINVGHADTPAMVRGRVALLTATGRSFL